MNDKRDRTLCVIVLIAALQACGGDDTATMNDAAGRGDRAAAGARADREPETQVPDNPMTDMPSDPVDTPAAPAPTTTGPKGYIGLFGDGTIGVLDIDAKKIVKTIPVTAPDGLLVSPDGTKVYVSSTDSGTVKVIATDKDELSRSIDVGSKPAGLAITPDGSLLVVAVGGADEAVIVDTKTDSVLRHVMVGQAHASCITADGHYAYVGSQVTTAPAVVKVDLTGAADPQSYAVDKSPRMLACEKDRIYFTAVGLDAIEVFDPASGKLEAPIPSDGSPHDVRASEPGTTELVVSQTAGDLELIDVASSMITDKIPTGKLAHWIALSADHKTAYVTNEGDDNVSVVDLIDKTVTDTIHVGKAPRKMSIRP